jgi:hypothetical protein
MLPHQLGVRRIGRQIKEPELSLQGFTKSSCFLRDVCGSAINDQKDLVLGPDDQTIKKIYEAKPLLVFVIKISMTNFVNLYGNDYPSMNLIYPALRGGIESGPEEPIEAAPQRFFC